MLAIHFVLVLRAGHYVSDRTIHMSLLLALFALTSAVGALIVKD